MAVKTTKTKVVAICQECMDSSGTKDLKDTDFFWVDRGEHCSLFCDKCVKKYDMVVKTPYKVVKKRKKKEDKKS